MGKRFPPEAGGVNPAADAAADAPPEGGEGAVQFIDPLARASPGSISRPGLVRAGSRERPGWAHFY